MPTLPKVTILAGFIAGLVGGMIGLWYLDGPREPVWVDPSDPFGYSPQIHPLVVVMLQLLVAWLALLTWETAENPAPTSNAGHYLDDAI
jgi:hypothetical protein